LAGTHVGISVGTQQVSQSVSQKRSILQPLVSSTLALAMFTLSALFFGAESSMRTLKSVARPHSQTELAAYERLTQKPTTYVFKEPSFSLTAAEDLFLANNISGSISGLNKLMKQDPHFYDAHEALARIYEFEKNWSEAIRVRKQMLTIDPYNPKLLTKINADENLAINPHPLRP
jgi:hypothetical protein